jgi:hypothetical protein
MLVLGTLVGACGSSRPPEAVAPPPPPADAPASVRPTTARYRVASHSTVQQDLQGQIQRTQLHLVYFTTLTVAPDTGNRMRATLIIDSILPDAVGIISPAERARAAGAQFSAVIEPDGRVSGHAGADSLLSLRLRQVATGFWQAYPRMPNGGVRPGEVSSDTTEMVSTSSDGTVTVRSMNQRSALAWQDRGGVRTLPIRVESNYTVEGSGQQMGQPFTLSGTGSRTMMQSVSADGKFIGNQTSDSARIEVMLTQMGLSIPGTQVRADTVTLLP